MAILPLAGREILTKLMTDMGMHTPIYSHDNDARGLVTVAVAVQLARPNLTPLPKTFASLPEYNIHVAEDIASRKALRYIESYYIGDNRVSVYFNSHVFVRTKKAWQVAADRLAHQLDVARDTIRKLHDQPYHSKLDHITQTDNIKNSHIVETLTTTTHLQELTEQTSKQHCHILLLENRLKYLETMNALLCIHHQGLLQHPPSHDTTLSTNSVQATLRTYEGTNMAPLPTTHANLTEL